MNKHFYNFQKFCKQRLKNPRFTLGTAPFKPSANALMLPIHKQSKRLTLFLGKYLPANGATKSQ